MPLNPEFLRFSRREQNYSLPLARTLAPFFPAKAQKFGAALEGVWVQD